VGDRSLAKRGAVYVLSVGVDAYSRGIPPLHYSGQRRAGLYRRDYPDAAGRSVLAAILTGADATRANILCGLQRLGSAASTIPVCTPGPLNSLQPSGPEDSVYIFFSGHGVSGNAGFFYSAHRRCAVRRAGKPGSFAERDIRPDLEREVEPILASQLVLVIDACGAGSLITSGESANAPLNLNGFAQLAREKASISSRRRLPGRRRWRDRLRARAAIGAL